MENQPNEQGSQNNDTATQVQQTPTPQSIQSESPKKFTSEDLNSIYTPVTSKTILNPMAGTFNPSKLTPDQVEAATTEWHSSKIVKFGGGFLYLFWAAVIIGMYRVVGAISFIVISAGIYISYRTYKKTKSPLVWAIFICLLTIVVIFLTVSSRSSS